MQVIMTLSFQYGGKKGKGPLKGEAGSRESEKPSFPGIAPNQ